MANSYGISTALAQLVLEAVLNNVALSFSTVCAQLHAGGSPGTAGTSNPAAETNRLQVNMSTANAAAQLSGAGPSWTIVATAGEDISALSLWSGFETDPNAVFLFSLPIVPNVQVAYGDTVSLTTLLLAATGLAS